MQGNQQNSAACCSLPAAHFSAPSWAEIDLDALTHNFRTLQSLLTPDSSTRGLTGDAHSSVPGRRSSLPVARLIPVVKANAYGHGAIPVAQALSGAGATAFAVARVGEGFELRQAGIRKEILVLEGAWPGQEEELLRHGLTATVYSADGVRRLGRAAQEFHTPVRVHIKVDTGMNRLGVAWDGIEEFLRAMQETPALQAGGVFSHLACAEEEDSTFTLEQIRRFRHALERMNRAGIEPGETHFANSAGLLYCPQLRTYSARPGIALYGYPPAPDRCGVSLKPVLTMKTRVGHIHTVRAGESIGYNRRFIAARETRAVTLPIGYADGCDRRLAGQGRVIIRGRWAPVLGAISMDMIVADITDLPEVREGDEVILLGSTAECRMDASVWATLLGTIPYEILSRISPRVPRVYRGGDDRSVFPR